MFAFLLLDVICTQKEINEDGDVDVDSSFLKYYFKLKESNAMEYPQPFAQSDFGVKYLDKLVKASTREQKYEVVTEALLEIAKIVDSAATVSEINYEIGVALFQKLTDADQRDKDFKINVKQIEENAMQYKKLILDDIDRVRDQVVYATNKVRREMMRKIRDTVHAALLETRDTRYNVQESVREESDNLMKNSSSFYITSFVCIQFMLLAIYYIYTTYRHRSSL